MAVQMAVTLTASVNFLAMVGGVIVVKAGRGQLVMWPWKWCVKMMKMTTMVSNYYYTINKTFRA